MAKDRCTLFPEGNWSECCHQHDRMYGRKTVSRWVADKLLYKCVRKKSNIVVASIMFIGVRLFGWYFYNKK